MGRIFLGKSLSEILIDKESKVATITFSTILEPIEPFYSLVCVDKKCRYYNMTLNETKTNKMKLKKYDKGWRKYE